MNIKQAAESIKQYVSCPPPRDLWGEERRHPALFLIGPPGVGKSAIVNQVGTEINKPVITVIASTLTPTDLAGLPIIVKEKSRPKVSFARPGFLPETGAGILFLDEVNAADESMQVALYRLVLEGKAGEHEIPRDWVIIAAGNRRQDLAVVREMSTALRTRFTVIEIEPDPEAWMDWALKTDVRPEVTGFIKKFVIDQHENKYFLYIPPKRTEVIRVMSEEFNFPTPRGWDAVSWYIECYTPEGSKPNVDVLRPYVYGAVGSVAGTAFLSYLETAHEVPPVSGVVSGRGPFPDFPDRPDIQDAYILTLYHTLHDEGKVQRGKTFTINKKPIKNVLDYVSQYVPKEWRAKFIGLFSSDEEFFLKLHETDVWADFTYKNKEVFHA